MGFVYLIGTPIFGWYKIGKSITPEVRIKDLGILLPFKISIIGVWRANNHHLMESTLHEMYSQHRINGEWFEFSKKKLYEVIAAIPSETLVYPSDNSHLKLDKFSNIFEDTKDNRLVYGVKVQKLRGDLTPEEREERKQASLILQKQRKEQKALAKESAK